MDATTKKRETLMLEGDVSAFLREGTSNASRYVRELIRWRRREWKRAYSLLTGQGWAGAKMRDQVQKLVGDWDAAGLPDCDTPTFAALQTLAGEVWCGNTELAALLDAPAPKGRKAGK